MRRETCWCFLKILNIVCFVPVWSEDRNGNNQQTFVVRYKNGDQTIPVTVVLDYRKQTEHVINMSPRTPAKSVTLYDFKQRTIAYKDLTNRECFLGHLTNETLNEETHALERLQSPVEHKPKLVSLDPKRSTLTPTEIRNIAGQKTAVFCRKMNTWLILSPDSHSVQKRDVNVPTYRRPKVPLPKVRYPHHEGETRRRYRTHHRNHTWRHSLSSRENNIQNIGNVNPGSTFERINLQRMPRQPVRDSLDLMHNRLHKISPEISLQHYHTFQGNDPEKENVDNFDSSSASNLEDHGKISILENLHNANQSDEIMSSNYVPEVDTVNVIRMYNKSWPKSMEEETRYSVPNGNFSETKFHPEPSFYNSGVLDLNFDSFDRNVIGSDGIQTSNQSQFETESKDVLTKSVARNWQLKSSEDANVNQNPDVSINILEVPKITKKFENVDQHISGPQANDDVHDVFEGFYNLRGNEFDNSDVFPTERSQNRDLLHHERYSTTNYPLNLETRNHFTDSTESNRENLLDDLRATHFTTNAEDTYTTSDYTNLATDPVTDPYTELYEPYSNSRIREPIKIRYEKNPSITPTVKNGIHDDDFLRLTPRPHTFTDVPVNENVYGYHRSDIPTENYDVNFNENNVPININVTNKRGGSIVPIANVQEGASLHQQRFHNILRHYKPVEITIDIEKIPTYPPPGAVLEFDSRILRTTKVPRANYISPTRNIGEQRFGQPPGHINYRQNTQRAFRRPIFHSQYPVRGTNIHRRKNLLRQYDSFNTSYNYQPLQQINKISPLSQPLDSLHHFDALNKNFLPLPPGVSIHPRHPKAPYADMFHPKMLPPVSQEMQFRNSRIHRQRHHRKKERLAHSCCSESLSGKLSSCCRTGEGKSPCCSSKYRGVHKVPTQQKNLRIRNKPPLQHVRKTIVEENMNKCQKEKMCRTLYETTKQVLVCRNIHIEGC